MRTLRFTSLFVGAATLALLGTTLQPTLAVAEDAPPADLPVMGEYDPADYVDEAAALPDDLMVAIDRDLNESPEQYLADSDAAIQASTVIDSLGDSGVDLLGSHMNGTELTVYVATDAAAAVAESTGAIAVLGEPAAIVLPEVPKSFATDVYGGQGFVWQSATDPAGYGRSCSIGFSGYLASNGSSQFATAGHCTDGMSDIVGSIYEFDQAYPGSGCCVTDTIIGLPTPGTTEFGSGYDVGRITAASGIVAKPQMLQWGGGAGTSGPLASAPLSITGITSAVGGATLCHSGSTTGWNCGEILGSIDALVGTGADQRTINSIVADVCVLPGDSGGSAVIGTAAVGITSWRGGTCGSGNQLGGFFPMAGSDETVASAYGTEWEIAVVPPVPTVNAGSVTTTLTGKLSKATAPNKVNVYIDGSSTPASVVASTGNWSLALGGLANGMHSYKVEGTYGNFSTGSSATGYFFKGAVDRIQGADRYATAAAVAAKFADAVDTLYLAYGGNYPDALSAAPAAAFVGGPLLLTNSTSLPATTAQAIVDADPNTIIVVGGTTAVSNSVVAQLKSLIPGVEVTRRSGANRYESSRIITSAGFAADTTTIAYVATGANFPDALAASAAAGHRDAPVILVDGASTNVDAPTKSLLAALGVTKIYVAGGTAVVSEGMKNSLAALPGVTGVVRLSGTDRYSTGLVINVNGFTSATDAYLAVGTGYADALAGAALAGATDSPLYVVPGNCVPAGVLGSLQTLGVTKIHLLGGAAVLNADVLALKQC